MKSTVLAAILATLVCVPPSHAALLEITGSATDLVLSNYSISGSTGLNDGDTVQRLLPTGALALTGPANVTFTYLGTEAGHRNFFISGVQIFDSFSSVSGVANYTINNVASGVLDFSFKDNNTSATVSNGSVANSFYTSIALFLEAGGTWLALFNDDCTCDKDFDDMAVRISAISAGGTNPSPVPIPAALPLLAAGLAGLGWISRRRAPHS